MYYVNHCALATNWETEYINNINLLLEKQNPNKYFKLN